MGRLDNNSSNTLTGLSPLFGHFRIGVNQIKATILDFFVLTSCVAISLTIWSINSELDEIALVVGFWCFIVAQNVFRDWAGTRYLVLATAFTAGLYAWHRPKVLQTADWGFLFAVFDLVYFCFIGTCLAVVARAVCLRTGGLPRILLTGLGMVMLTLMPIRFPIYPPIPLCLVGILALMLMPPSVLSAAKDRTIDCREPSELGILDIDKPSRGPGDA